ncbi:hypothetical protein Hamer_G016739, partial [Homarus americanus]
YYEGRVIKNDDYHFTLQSHDVEVDKGDKLSFVFKIHYSQVKPVINSETINCVPICGAAVTHCENINIVKEWDTGYLADFKQICPVDVDEDDGLTIQWTFSAPVDSIDYYQGRVIKNDDYHFTLQTDDDDEEDEGEKLSFFFTIHYSHEKPIIISETINGVLICDGTAPTVQPVVTTTEAVVTTTEPVVTTTVPVVTTTVHVVTTTVPVVTTTVPVITTTEPVYTTVTPEDNPCEATGLKPYDYSQ